MDDKWRRVRELFDSALRREPEERRDFLVRESGDASILAEVESLLSSLEAADDFLDKPILEAPTEQINKQLTGRTIGHYTITRKIGAGGMGEVYLAMDTTLDRPVAIKLLNPEYERNEDNVRRFIREAKSASALNHPNILTILEIGEIDGSHYIVSEYVDGETLRHTLKHRQLELPSIIDITVQIANALAAAHKARIIHRDIKPENVIVREDGIVKVLDFGLAKLISDGEQQFSADGKARQNTTAAGVILGTVNYMSPEQAKGKKVDERTDIFSLGVVLYEMITGEQPFAGDSMPETFRNLIDREPEPINSYVSGIPDELQRITSRMLEKSPEDRYQTIGEAADDLRDLESTGIVARLGGRVQPQNRTEVMQQTTGGGANTTAEQTGSYRGWYLPWPVLLLIGVLLLGSIGLGGYLWLQRTSSSYEIRSVAVMPFVNETGDPQVEYLSDGMTDTLISSLSELPNIKVKARTSVFRYKGKEIDPKAIGKELGVQAIVNGRVSQRDGRTNVLLEVVDTETEDVILLTKYDKPQSELVMLQSNIARDVSGKLQNRLSGADEAKVTKAHTADPEALTLYLQGQFYRHKGGRSNVLSATDYFNKAIEKDPNYALAYAGLALNYASYRLYNMEASTEYAPKAKAAALRAVELDDSLAEAHVALGQWGGDPEQELRRAIELNPNYADAHDALCVLLTMSKRFDDGISECKKARELDPSSAVVATDLGAAYFFARRPDEAIETLTQAHEIDLTLWVPLGYLGAAQTLKGQYIEAAATFRKAIEISDGSPNTKSHLAYALAKAGQRDEALKLIEDLKRHAEREYIGSFHFAMPYIGLGDRDNAFFWLGKGIDDGSIGFSNLDVHPWFDELRSDPRFTALLERAKPSE